MKRIALSLIILALAVSARAETRPIAAGTPAGVVTLCGDDGDGNCTLGGAGLDVSGSTVDLGDIGPAATAALQGGGMPAALGAGGGIKSEGSQADGVAQTANPVVIGGKSVVDAQVETIYSQGGFLGVIPLGSVAEGTAIINPITVGGKDTAGASRAIKTDTSGAVFLTSQPPWCSVQATSSVAQLSAATDNQSVSTGCTGACQKSSCKNLSPTDILCVRPSSGGNKTCLLPGDSVEFTANTSCFFDNSAAPATSGTQYVTALGCDP